MSGAVLELGIVSRNSADIYKYREINEKKKTYWVFFWKGCICQLHTVYKKDCSFIMRFQSCSIYIIHKSLNFSTNYLVELYVSSQMCSSVRSDFDLPPTPSLHAGTKSAWYPFVAMWEAGKLLSSKCTVSERVLCILSPVCLHQSVSNGGKASEEENIPVCYKWEEKKLQTSSRPSSSSFAR